mmetsp:Transcript_40605/g.90279  ORF Transcript_40605/g.90279 Transcript_40605/m.90279 type:complete len:147 (-) Transcript_40605:3753-4193(-)
MPSTCNVTVLFKHGGQHSTAPPCMCSGGARVLVEHGSVAHPRARQTPDPFLPSFRHVHFYPSVPATLPYCCGAQTPMSLLCMCSHAGHMDHHAYHTGKVSQASQNRCCSHISLHAALPHQPAQYMHKSSLAMTSKPRRGAQTPPTD